MEPLAIGLGEIAEGMPMKTTTLLHRQKKLDDPVVTIQTQTTKAHHHQDGGSVRIMTQNVAEIAIETTVHHHHRQRDRTLPQTTKVLHHGLAAVGMKKNGHEEVATRTCTMTTQIASGIQSVTTTGVVAPRDTIPTASTTDGGLKRIQKTVP
jgi:hypothetical protein